MVPHRMVTWNGYNTVVCWQLREDDVSPIFTPLYHAGGLGAFLIPVFTIGGTIVLHRGFDAAEVWRTIERERCTVVLGVPTIWKLLMEAPEFADVDLSHVRWLISGGAPLPQYIIDAYQRRGVVFKQGYGLTEVGVNCFAMTVEDSVRKKGLDRQAADVHRGAARGRDGHEVPVGEVGELWLRGPHVSRGYWNNPEATAAGARRGRLVPHRRPGPARRRRLLLHRRTSKGHVHQRRRQRLSRPRSRRSCCSHPDGAGRRRRRRAARRRGARSGVAFVVARPGRAPSPDVLVAHLDGRLARYKIPNEFVFVDALPRTPYGKVVKADLERAYTARGGRAS